MSDKTPRINRFVDNLCINGNMDIWQRGTNIASTAGDYLADRFAYRASPALLVEMDQSTDVPSLESLYALDIKKNSIVVPANNELGYLKYVMEGHDFRRIAGKTATIAFKVKSSKVGTYCLNLRNGDSDRILIKEYEITQANVYQEFYITVDMSQGTASGNWDYDNLAGLQVRWELAVGSDFHNSPDVWINGNYHSTANQVNLFEDGSASFKLAQVMIYEGSLQVPFQAEKDVAALLQRCKRYYENYSYSGVGGVIANGSIQASNLITAAYNWSVEKRAVPTMSSTFATDNGWAFRESNAFTALSNNASFGEITTTGCLLFYSGTHGAGANGTAGQFTANTGGTGKIYIDADYV